MQFLHISVVSILEIRLGILSIQRRDATRADIRDRWLSRQVIPAFAARILNGRESRVA